MKTLVKIIIYVGFLFYGGGFLIAFCQFILYNGMGNFFSYYEAENAKIDYVVTYLKKAEVTNIEYIYTVNKKLYKNKESIGTSVIKKRNIQINKVYYNKTFPFISYVGDNKHNLRKAKVGMIIMSFSFLLIFTIYKFTDLDKWIGVYTRGEYKSSKRI